MVHVYGIADKYDVPALRTLAATQLTKLLEPAGDKLDSFITAIRAIDEHTPDNILWEIVIPKIVANMSWLADDVDFFALLQEMPALTKSLLKGTAEMATLTSPRSPPAEGLEDYELDYERSQYGGGRWLG